MKISKAIIILSAVFLLGFSFDFPDNWQNKIEDIVREKTDNGEIVPVIVLLKDQANVNYAKKIKGKDAKTAYVFNTLSEHADQSQKSIIHFLESKRVDYKRFKIVNAIALKASKTLVETIAKRDDVKSISEDALMMYERPVEVNTSHLRAGEPEWGIKMIQADSVWKLGYRGEGVVVAGQDTGYEWDNALLIDKYRGWNGTEADHNYNWHDAIREINPLHGDTLVTEFTNPCGLDSPEPCDDHNHGTHTMGTMVGEDEDNSIGVAPGAQWIACRNMERGYGTPSTYTECFEWFLAPTDLEGNNPDPSRSPHVINNSWSCPEMEGCNASNWDLMNTVVNNLRAAGIVVVVSAGNRGANCSTVNTPSAMFEGSFTVGATRPNDTIANFSSRGLVMVDSSFRLKPNVAAPGQNVRSVIRGGNFASFSGTSMAGPHVAGLVALIINANPQLAGEVDIIEDIIETTAVPKTTDQECGGISGETIPNPVYGYGRINALAAVEMALNTTVSANENEEITKEDILIFPNPAVDEIYFSYKGEGYIQSITIMDNIGRKILRKTYTAAVKNDEMDVSGLNSGVYFYIVESTAGNAAGKWIKL